MTAGGGAEAGRAFVLGTAGHVDHGKTALVRALTGVETDRLPEEKRRGISIELGFAPWRLAGDLAATLIDVPGHRRLVHTMIAGASGIELVLVVVAANEGVMPQTREHVRVCEELGIGEAIVVLTKSDLVDEETLALAEAEAMELVAGSMRASAVACSAATGAGIGAVRDAVAARLRALPAWKGTGPARLWVDRVLSIKGAGTVVTGTLSAGSVRRGDELALVGARGARVAVARELRVQERAAAVVHAPTRLAVNLPIDAGDVRRGDLLTADRALVATGALDAVLRGARAKRGAEVSVHVGSAHVPATLTRVLALEDGVQLARLVLAEPCPLRGGDRFVVRGAGKTKDTSVAGGGTVMDARPAPRARAAARRALAAATRAGDAGAALACLVAEASPAPVDLAGLYGRLAIDATLLARAADAAVKRGELVRVGEGVMAKAALGALSDQARALVAEHAARAPLDRGMPLATLTRKLAARAGDEAAAAAIRAARARRSEDDAGLIAIEGDVVIPAHKARAADPRIGEAVERARAALQAAAGHGLSLAKAEEACGKAGEARAILALLERQGAAVHAGDLWFSRALVDAVRDAVARRLAAAGSLTVLDVKAMADLPRKQAVLLLEHFDRVGLTRRKGEARVAGTAASAGPDAATRSGERDG